RGSCPGLGRRSAAAPQPVRGPEIVAGRVGQAACRAGSRRSGPGTPPKATRAGREAAARYYVRRVAAQCWSWGQPWGFPGAGRTAGKGRELAAGADAGPACGAVAAAIAA